MTFQVTEGMRSKRLRGAALAYARAGVAVLAVWGISNGKCDCGNAKCKKPGKHPITSVFPKGFQDATTDPVFIAKVWTEHPNANIGIVPDGDFGVLDFDGEVGLKAAKVMALPETVRVITGRGEHRYFLGFPHGQLAKVEGVDIRAHSNGYILAPPSNHASGKRYRFADDTNIPASFPASLHPKRTVSVSFGPRKIGEGSRNNHLTRFGGIARSAGLEGETLAAVLVAINSHDCKPPLERSEVLRIARSVGRYPAASEEAIGDLTDVEPEDVRFLFGPYIPRGALTVLDGQPGQGKSSFCTALVAAVTTGRGVSWSKDRPKGSALIFSAEDDPARVLKPRLMAQGANIDRVRYQIEPFTLDARGLDLLQQDMIAHHPSLVLIDPITAYLTPDKDMDKAVDMTQFLGRLDRMAREFDCAILIVRHLRKAADDNALNRGLGSVAVIARVRSGLQLGRHPEDPDMRIVVHVKSNLGPEGDTIVFSMQSDGGPPKIRWEATDPNLGAEHIVTSRPVGRPSKEGNEAEAFLRRLLANGPCEKSEVTSAAEGRAISKMTLRRAAKELGVMMRKKGRQSFWSLPELPDE